MLQSPKLVVEVGLGKNFNSVVTELLAQEALAVVMREMVPLLHVQVEQGHC